MTTEEHLAAIVAKCRELLAIAEKRTPGKWFLHDGDAWDQDGVTIISSRDDGTSAFIAACSGPAEAGWRATIAAIESRLAEREQAWTNWELTAQISSFDAGSKSDYPFHKSLLDIIAAWPEELLK